MSEQVGQRQEWEAGPEPAPERRQGAPLLAEAWRQTLHVAAVFQLALVLMVGWQLWAHGATSLAAGYFFDHDGWLLIAGGAMLLVLARWSLTGMPVPALTQRRLWLWAGGAAIIAYAGTFLVFHHYPVTRDEQSALFAATYFADGRMGWPIPAGLADLAYPMMPMHTGIRPGGWLSNYLPVNAALRAGAGMLGDPWLAGPILLLVGALALATAARRIWPERPQGATIAVVLALSSTQVLANAATLFAMTAQFTATALWLACFLRGDRRGHVLAMLVGLFASGLHQSHFHIGFVLAFAVWLATERRFRLAGCYVTAAIVYWLVWQRLWPVLLSDMMGPPITLPTMPIPPSNPILWRISQLQIGESLTRFIAWQNVLLLPLVIAGAGALRTAIGPTRVLIGCAFACTLGLMLLVLQDHGYGYRYLHHLIPCFCLLGAEGWLALEERLGHRLPLAVLTASAMFAALVTLPVTIWRSMAANAPYERAYAAARTADADYVLVDTRAGAYLQDIVRVEAGRVRPVLLDLGYVPAPALARICAGERVMVFGEAAARHFAIPINPDAVANQAEATARAAQLKRLHCGTPVPL